MPIWKSSLILVIEDDSQDGLDHVDAHRIPALAISPYAKHGAVVHDRYDFLSFIRTMEIVTGMRPLNLFEAVATPMYDAFDADPSDNDEPYDAIVPEQDLLEHNPESATNAELSEGLPLELTDRTRSGSWTGSCTSTAPTPSRRPPGPNASGIDDEAEIPDDDELLRELQSELRRALIAGGYPGGDEK